MKRITIFLLSFGLLFGCTGVASADVGAKKVPKTEAFTSTHYDATAFVFEANTDEAFEVNVSIPLSTNFLAVMPEGVLVPGGNITFIGLKKPSYDSPDIDRKWVWWYSVVTNS